MRTRSQCRQRLGDFAVKHKMLVAYHAHTQATLTA